MRTVRASWWALVITAMVGIAVALSACATKPVDPCQVQPTHTDAQGQCVEYDGELCDGDPCDADDFSEVSERSKPSPKATKPKTSTTKRR